MGAAAGTKTGRLWHEVNDAVTLAEMKLAADDEP
jgi:hypothetical protein